MTNETASFARAHELTFRAQALCMASAAASDSGITEYEDSKNGVPLLQEMAVELLGELTVTLEAIEREGKVTPMSKAADG